MRTTIEQGNDFCRRVSELLSFAGFFVQGETLVGHKKVDLLAEHVRFGVKRHRVAVECKNLSSPLRKDAVAQIYADYLPLVSTGSVDEILLVTASGLIRLCHIAVDRLRCEAAARFRRS